MRGFAILLSLLTFLVPAAAGAAVPPIRHVFVIVLENQGAGTTFAPGSSASYLNGTLRPAGEFLPNYYGITHLSLGNYVAMISGQASNFSTQSDCQLYTDVVPGTIAADGQALGAGCVYPSTVKTIADQLTARGLSWKGYMEDMGNSSTAPATCRHPDSGSTDPTQSARAGDQYAARHNPFVYFHSIIDTPSCAVNDLPLDRLPSDLAAASSTASYSLIAPNLCNDGHDSPCKDGSAGGLVAADAFLREWVPRIQASPGYQEGGLIVVTFDEADAGPSGDASACCNAPFPYPNTPNPGGPVPGRGGGRTGTVLLSQYVKPGSTNPTPYNHFALLASVEDLFGLSRLGYAGRADLKSFGDDVYNAQPSAAEVPSGTTTITNKVTITTTLPVPAPAPPKRTNVARPSGSCRSRALPRAHGRLRRGSLITSVKVTRMHGHTYLAVQVRHSSRLSVTKGGRRRHFSRLLRACRRGLLALPRRHGTVVFRASLPGRYESRRVRY